MKIKTEILQEMVAKAIQGSSNNKLIPITSLIGIELKENILTLMTTDGSNQLRVIQNLENEIQDVCQEFYTIVNAETFAKLVGKTTKEYIELSNNENYLEVKGNGTYKLEIPVNEDGEMIRFPKGEQIEDTNAQQISIEKLKNILTSAKVSVAKTMEVPCLTGYYLSDKVVFATDRQVVCAFRDTLFDTPLLISDEMAELLQLLDGDYVTLYKQDNKLRFETNNVVISGKELEGKEIYPVQALENLISLEYGNTIKINKNDLIDVLDRMALFVNDNYDKNGVRLAFTKEALLIKSQKSNAQELIDAEATSDEEFNCLIDITMLQAQIKTISTDTITICYGQDKSIKIIDGLATIIISLLDENN
jgi:DNA polymerase III sliding clamp (beta) subunit (PCNA family)